MAFKFAAFALALACSVSATCSRFCTAAEPTQQIPRPQCERRDAVAAYYLLGSDWDFWDGRDSFDLRLSFDTLLHFAIANRCSTSVLATNESNTAFATEDQLTSMLGETAENPSLPSFQTFSPSNNATEAEFLTVRVPTKISTSYADWLLTNGILVPKLNTPGQGVDLGYNLQLQRWF